MFFASDNSGPVLPEIMAEKSSSGTSPAHAVSVMGDSFVPELRMRNVD